MSAFHSAHPRPRDHVAGSTPSPERNAPRLAPQNSVQAITTSHAGSPTAAQPKSITAASRPSCSRRLLAATSPWTQTGAPSHAALRASSNTRRTASVGTPSPSASSARAVSSAYLASGPPRKKLCGPGAGPPAAGARRNATRNDASAVASATGFATRADDAGTPSSHRYTDHGYG